MLTTDSGVAAGSDEQGCGQDSPRLDPTSWRAGPGSEPEPLASVLVHQAEGLERAAASLQE